MERLQDNLEAESSEQDVRIGQKRKNTTKKGNKPKKQPSLKKIIEKENQRTNLQLRQRESVTY